VTFTHVTGGRPNELKAVIRVNGRALIEHIPSLLVGLRLIGNNVILPSQLVRTVNELLDLISLLPASEVRKKVTLATEIFSHFTDPGGAVPNPTLRRMYMRAIMELAWNWEKNHEEVHKGTPYFFMGKSYHNSGDLASALVCFFQAVEEDKRNYPAFGWDYKTAPAYLTVSLVNNVKNNVYETIVRPARETLGRMIGDYNNRYGRSFSMNELENKFLQADPLEEKKRFFVATFQDIFQLLPLVSAKMTTNDYSKLKHVDLLANICLVNDQLLEHKYLQGVTSSTMAKGVYALALAQGWTTAALHNNAGAYTGSVTPRLNNATPDQTIPDILDGRAIVGSRTAFPLEASVLLAYHIRNFASHNIEGNSVFASRFEEIYERVMHAFFFIVEQL
jgi:hypothetical protein